MDYEKAITLYMKCRREKEIIEAATKLTLAPLNQKLSLLLTYVEMKALQDGLKNVPIEGVGTGYWTTHASAKVANAEAFWAFVKENEAWDLVENRACSSAVKSYIEGNDTPVPGVNFSQVQIFKIRAANEKE